MNDIAVFATPDIMTRALVVHLEATAASAIAEAGTFNWVVTGGYSATALYPALARARVEWDRVHIFYGDERVVPLDDEQSNHRAVHAALGSTGAVFHPFDTSGGGENAARRYEAALPPRLDLVNLGMGPDGHVASLFPGHPALEEKTRRVTWIDDSPKPPPARVTFTVPTLVQGGVVWFLVVGLAKAEQVTAALTDSSATTPAAIVHRAARRSVWFLDEGAASGLQASDLEQPSTPALHRKE